MKHFCPQHGDWDDEKTKMCYPCALEIGAKIVQANADAQRARSLSYALRPRRKVSLIDRIFPTDIDHF